MSPHATACGRWMIAAMLIGIAAVGPARPAPADVDSEARRTLAAFEQTLERQPDDLRTGADYRQLAIRLGLFDRSIKFLSRLARANPATVNAHLNLALAYVDKVAAVGLLRQIFLGVTRSTRSPRS